MRAQRSRILLRGDPQLDGGWFAAHHSLLSYEQKIGDDSSIVAAFFTHEIVLATNDLCMACCARLLWMPRHHSCIERRRSRNLCFRTCECNGQRTDALLTLANRGSLVLDYISAKNGSKTSKDVQHFFVGCLWPDAIDEHHEASGRRINYVRRRIVRIDARVLFYGMDQ